MKIMITIVIKDTAVTRGVRLPFRFNKGDDLSPDFIEQIFGKEMVDRIGRRFWSVKVNDLNFTANKRGECYQQVFIAPETSAGIDVLMP